GVRQRHGEHLIRTAARVVAMLAVDDVIEVTARVVPEAAVERLPRTRGMRGEIESVAAAVLRRPPGGQTERVVPERVQLHRLAAARRDDPVADLRVHPRELVALGPLREQPVGGIDANAEARAGEMVPD